MSPAWREDTARAPWRSGVARAADGQPGSDVISPRHRRGGWVHRRQEGSLPLFLRGSAALGRLFRQGVSGRNGGSLLRWPCRGLRFLWRRAKIGSLRQSMDASRARRSDSPKSWRRRSSEPSPRFLGRLKPFDKWAIERNQSEFDKEIYWRIVASLRKSLEAG